MDNKYANLNLPGIVSYFEEIKKHRIDQSIEYIAKLCFYKTMEVIFRPRLII